MFTARRRLLPADVYRPQMFAGVLVARFHRHAVRTRTYLPPTMFGSAGQPLGRRDTYPYV